MMISWRVWTHIDVSSTLFIFSIRSMRSLFAAIAIWNGSSHSTKIRLIFSFSRECSPILAMTISVISRSRPWPSFSSLNHYNIMTVAVVFLPTWRPSISCLRLSFISPITFILADISSSFHLIWCSRRVLLLSSLPYLFEMMVTILRWLFSIHNQFFISYRLLPSLN